jgi:3-keto-5-aminohexanoate cleavage enzyme
MTSIDWERVQAGLERAQHSIIWRPYGLPAVTSLERSVFFDGEISTPWDIPGELIVSVAITGGFFGPSENPSQPITPDQILHEAVSVAEVGASAVHLHVRSDQGYNELSFERFSTVVEALREKVPGVAIDGCLVPSARHEWDEMNRVLEAGLLEAVPINTTATFVGDALFAKPIPVMLEKVRLMQENGVKPIISCYTDGDVGNADRFLFRSGLVERPSYWIILPAIPGCSPMENPRQMVQGLTRIAASIYDVDPDATILVCAAGRASTYLVTLAAVMGLHIRVGMEDTVWMWPHKPDKVKSNAQMFETAKLLAQVVGRTVATPAEYRQIVGLTG